MAPPVRLRCLVALAAAAAVAVAQNETDPASFVHMFIGTTNGGHVFPGESAFLERRDAETHVARSRCDAAARDGEGRDGHGLAGRGASYPLLISSLALTAVWCARDGSKQDMTRTRSSTSLAFPLCTTRAPAACVPLCPRQPISADWGKPGHLAVTLQDLPDARLPDGL
jgi:hypothetical protein